MTPTLIERAIIKVAEGLPVSSLSFERYMALTYISKRILTQEMTRVDVDIRRDEEFDEERKVHKDRKEERFRMIILLHQCTL